MVKINGFSKIKDFSDPAFNPSNTSADGTSTNKSGMIADIENALAELSDVMGCAYVTEESMGELNILKAKLMSYLAILKADGVGSGSDGSNPGDTGSVNPIDPNAVLGQYVPAGLEWGINTIEDVKQCLDVYAKEQKDGYQSKHGNDLLGEFYEGTYELSKSTDPNRPAYFAFQGSEFTTKVVLESDGDDLILIEYYKDEEGEPCVRYWRLADGSKRPDIAVIISLQGMKHDVIVDARNARIPDTLWIHGGEGNDTIYGSLFGKNYIVGNGGNDELWGGWRNDTIFGDYTDLTATTGGDDTIYGMLGKDQLYGGAGIDFYDVDSEDVLDNSLENELDTKMTSDEISALLDKLEQSSNPTGWNLVEKNGLIYFENDGTTGGSLNIDMQALGINNLLLKEEGTDLVFYYQTVDGKLGKFAAKNYRKASANAPWGTTAPNVGALNKLFRINITGGPNGEMVDASLLKLNDTSVILNINTEGGDDLVIGPKDNMSGFNLDQDSLKQSTCSNSELNYYADNILINDDGSVTTEVKDGAIIVTPIKDENGKYINSGPYYFNAPLGYDKAFISYEGGYHVVTLVKPGIGDSPADTIVYKFEALPGTPFATPDMINFAHPVETTGENGTTYEPSVPIPLVAISLLYDDYQITGGLEGDDIVVIGKYTNNKGSDGNNNMDSDDEIMEMIYENK